MRIARSAIARSRSTVAPGARVNSWATTRAPGERLECEASYNSVGVLALRTRRSKSSSIIRRRPSCKSLSTEIIQTRSEHPMSRAMVVLMGHAAFWNRPRRSSFTVGASASGRGTESTAWASAVSVVVIITQGLY